MALIRCICLVLSIGLALFVLSVVVEASPDHDNITTVYDVTKFGAKGDGKPHYDENGESITGIKIIRAWMEACRKTVGKSKVLIPKGTFVVAQVVFNGPCQSHVTVELQGKIVPDPDVSQFPNNILIQFQQLDGVTFTGSGIIDCKNRGPPKSKEPTRDIDFFSLMSSIQLIGVKNAVIEKINSKNPSAFHILVAQSQNVKVQDVKFDAEFLAPDSDTSGVYISASNQVTVFNSFIRTGDDCITIAPGSSDIFAIEVTCSAGQGIGIGQDPYVNEALDVKRVRVKNCIFKETTYGGRIITRPQASASQVSDIIFEDLGMKRVKNPFIVINQLFLSKPDKSIQAKVEGVQFRDINGTTTAKEAVSMSCNPKSLCQDILVVDIRLQYVGKPLLSVRALGP